MKKVFIGLYFASLFLSVVEASSNKVICDVTDLSSARECVKKWAYQQEEEGLMPHTVGVSNSEKSKFAFSEVAREVATSEYVAVVEVHYDEDIIYYLELEKGSNVSPKIALETTNVEIWEDLKLEDDPSEELVDKYRLYISGLEDFHLD